MIIFILFAQRREQYTGEHAPEALEVMTEFDFAENPEWMMEKLVTQQALSQWESVKIVEVKVEMLDLLNILRPPRPGVDGKILKAPQL